MVDPSQPIHSGPNRHPRLYRRALKAAEGGDLDQARAMLDRQLAATANPPLRALVLNDLAAIEALAGKVDGARQRLREAVALDAGCSPARLNATFLEASGARAVPFTPVPPPAPTGSRAEGPVRVAILSLLFNWPSTGGGTVRRWRAS